MKDWSNSETPRTWQFWAIWAAIRFVLGLTFYGLGWMPAFWFLLGELLPDAMWYLRDEELKALKRSIEPTIRRLAHLSVQNDSLRATAQGYQDRYGRRPVISSITTAQTWTAPSKKLH